jgi:recombination protein RecT
MVENNKLMVLAQSIKEKAFETAFNATIPTTIKQIMSLERATNIIIRNVQKNPLLLDCDSKTIKQCLLDSAALGLELGGPLHHAYVIPYFNKKKNKYEAQLQIGFQGLLELIRRTGEIDGAPIVQWVHENDIFTIDFASHQSPIKHSPVLDRPRGEPKLVYCLTWFKSGGYHFDFMTIDEIKKHMNQYAKKDKQGKLPATWLDHFEEMGRKTILKRAAKYMPMSSELAEAIEQDESNERGEPSTITNFEDLQDPQQEPIEEESQINVVITKLENKDDDANKQ